MRKIIATARVSLDGVMQGPGAVHEDTSDGFDFGGWVTEFRDPKGGAATMSLVHSSGIQTTGKGDEV